MSTAIDVREAFRIHRSPGGSAVALQGLTLEVQPEEIVVVLGPSGSGKTTLLRAIGGFEQLSAGTVRVLGREIGAMSGAEVADFRSRHLGLLDQHYARALSPDLSCVHTVALSSELAGEPRAAARSTAASLLERVGLGDRLQARPRELSGGEQQRVAVCAALAHRPGLLLADEPAGELDAMNAEAVYALIAQLVREEAGAALIVSHDEMAAEIADRLVFVRDGRVVEEARRGSSPTVVVNAPGWIRVPEEILEAMGRPDRLEAELQPGSRLALSAAAGSRRAEPGVAGGREQAARHAGGTAAELLGVSKRFPGAPRAVVDGLSYAFREATFTAIVGRSGSGKTTLLHLLAGLDRPDEGEIMLGATEIGGIDRAQAAALRRRAIEVITQEPGLIPHLTALENVALGLRIKGIDDDLLARAEAALRDVGLAERLSHRADRLSAGERQRVAIARAVASRPALLLADEPTARLDRTNARAVAELLRRLAHDTGSAVICATHDEAVIEQADEILALAGAVAAGKPILEVLSG